MGSHPITYLVLDLLEADARRDKARAEEIHKSLAARGWRVAIERCEPPQPVREPQAEAPPVAVGSFTAAQERINILNKDRGHQGAGVC